MARVKHIDTDSLKQLDILLKTIKEFKTRILSLTSIFTLSNILLFVWLKAMYDFPLFEINIMVLMCAYGFMYGKIVGTLGVEERNTKTLRIQLIRGDFSK